MMQVTQEINRLISFLGDNSNGEYYVVGYQKQRKNAESVRGKRMVQVYYSGGSFPKNLSPMNYATAHNAIATVRMMVSESARADLAVLNDPNSSEADRMNALASSMDAEQRANERLDELFSMMFNLIMGGDGEHFGNDQKPYTISDRWCEDFRKDSVLKDGSLIVVNGYFDISFRVEEIPTGHVPVDGNILDGKIDIQGDIDKLEVLTGE